MKRIGLISDTHGLLRPEARVALRGCEIILHAGDICDPKVLESLGEIAPVTAVRGNNDIGSWAHALPVHQRIEIDDVRIHIVHDAADLTGEEGADVIVTGHSHKPSIRMDGSVLHVNPGSAGPRRFTLPISLGFLEIIDGRPRARVQTLEVD